MTQITAPGIYQLESDAYHADPAPLPSLSSTIAKELLAKSPLHAWTKSPRLNPDFEPVDKKHFDVGRAAHAVILGKGDEFAEIPDDILASNGAASTKAAKEFIADCREAGVTPLKRDEIDAVDALANAARTHLRLLGIKIDPAYAEQAAFAQIDGIWCRAMFDYAPPGVDWLLDVKTTTNANPDACVRAVMDYGYDVQDRHYRDVWKAVTGEDRRMRFLFVEKEAPHACCVVELGGETDFIATKKIRRAREIWAGCLSSGKWPGYPVGINRVELPNFAMDRWLERESVEADFKKRTGHDILDAARKWQAPEQLAGE